MKRLLLALIAAATLGVSGCKKEEAANPDVKGKVIADQKDNTGWD